MRERQFTDCVDIVGSSCKPFEGNRRYISTGAVATDHIDESDVEIVDYKSRPSRADLVVEPETLLFAKMQGTKKTLYVDKENAENIYSTGFFALKAKSGVISTRCLYHLLGSASFLTQKDKNCSGATQKAITNAGLKKIRVSIPDYQLQEAIADQLDKISSVIQMRRSELQKLDDLVKARFVEMFGDPIHNENKWSKMPLDLACRVIVDCPHSTPIYLTQDTGYMCIRTSIVKKNKILWNEIEFISESEYLQRIKRKKPEKGDIIYTREGAILGIAAIIDRKCNVALGQRSMLLSPDKRICTSEFLCTAMNFESFLDNALKGVIGSASPHINVGDIKAFQMIMPPVDLQYQFSLFVQQIDKSKFVVQQALDKAQLLFDSLMQQYFG